MLSSSRETVEQSIRIFMGTSGIVSFFINCFGIYLICYHHGMMDDYRYYLLYFQKNMLPAPMLKFSQIFSNVLPLVGTIAYAFSEPNDSQKRKIIDEKYSSIAAWLSEVKGIAIYDIDVSLNPSFFFLTFGIMSGTFILSTSYAILYTQLYVMLNSIKSKISHKTFKKHSVAIVSTVMQNLVFVIFFVSPIFLLAIVIYTGRDASGSLA
ncbi:Protein CBR-SRI-18 [Caenorhabditis briggsae]|uniref:Protein CBR-SRI-18 n=1 Tax=Caenorhabditis briggsae TaxID=6238 RepID=A8X8S7_CAEBR|nr:Protein CBR-SRI-18 [Caenorhabditis briggsae]CAP29038.2 Protein CBR-SRI-18 [Caenorhabditis briggsae]